MTSLSLFDYLRWVRQHWLLTAGFFALAMVAAVLYTKQMPPLYRATVFFTIDPMVYQQGLLRRLDDLVIGTEKPSLSKAITRRPEVRPAFYASSPAFHQQVAAQLKPAVSEMFVRQHLHYYRYELEKYHALQWHFAKPAQAQKQLDAIFQLLSQQLTSELRSGFATQLAKLQQIDRQRLTPEMSALLAQQIAITHARHQLVSSGNFSLLIKASDVEISSGPVYPERIWVIFVMLLAWGVIGATAVNFYLLRKLRLAHAAPTH